MKSYADTIYHLARERGYSWESMHYKAFELSTKLMICLNGENIYNAKDKNDLFDFLCNEIDKGGQIKVRLLELETAIAALRQAELNLIETFN